MMARPSQVSHQYEARKKLRPFSIQYFPLLLYHLPYARSTFKVPVAVGFVQSLKGRLLQFLEQKQA